MLFSTVRLSNWTPKITRILTLYQANAPMRWGAIVFNKTYTYTLILFGTHNLQTFKHSTLINELLLSSFTYLIFVPNCIAWSYENYASHSSELSQLHQQPVDAVVRPTSIQKLCYKLPNSVTFTFIRTFYENFVFFTEWRHVDRQCEAYCWKFALFSASGLKDEKLIKQDTCSNEHEVCPMSLHKYEAQ